MATLRELNIDMCNDLKDESFQKFFDGVPEINNLEVLKCENNKIGNLGLASLAKCHILKNLETLNLDSAHTPNDTEWESLFTKWPQKSKLKTLILTSSSIAD